MSHVTMAHQGLADAEARRWDEAIIKLTKALRESLNPAWLIARSKALINTGRFAQALEDADQAWHSAYQRNKRDLMIEADYRRAVAYFRMGEYANADSCCLFAMKLIKGGAAVEKEALATWVDEKGFWKFTLADATAEAREDEINKPKDGGMLMGPEMNRSDQAKDWRMASTLRQQILRAMERIPEDDPARKPTVEAKPAERKLLDLNTQIKQLEASTASAASAASAASTVSTANAAAKPVVPADTPLRLQDFQSSATMSVSIFSKGIDKEKFEVKFLPFSAHLDPVVYPNGDEKEFKLDLWGEIDPDQSKYTVTPNKVELVLKKKTPGKWPQVRGEARPDETSNAETTTEVEEKKASESTNELDDKTVASAVSSEGPAHAPSADTSADTMDKGKGKDDSNDVVPPAATAAVPSYPTSSKGGSKDWDKFGSGDSDDEDAQDVNFFFKKLFKNASPEQQRAMMKSFTESNGTSLSTDWNDVKDRKVETIPPDGVVPRKW